MSVNLHESAQLFKPTSKKFMIWCHGDIINYTSYTTYIKHFLLLINNTLVVVQKGARPYLYIHLPCSYS